MKNYNVNGNDTVDFINLDDGSILIGYCDGLGYQHSLEDLKERISFPAYIQVMLGASTKDSFFYGEGQKVNKKGDLKEYLSSTRRYSTGETGLRQASLKIIEL